MNVVPFRAEHAYALELQLGQRGIKPFLTKAYVESLVGDYAFSGLIGDRVVAVGGVFKMWEGRGVVWSLIDQSAGEHFVAIHKAAKGILDAAPFRRLEADTPCTFAQGHRWLRLLGFHLEAPCMEAYQPDGTDSALYARIR